GGGRRWAPRRQAGWRPGAGGRPAGLLAGWRAGPPPPAPRSLCRAPAEPGDEGLRRLASSPHLPQLRKLQVFDRRTVGPRGLADLLASPLWARLTDFGLSHATIGDEAARLLAPTLARGGLRRLSLCYWGLGARAARALATAPSWGPLEELELDGNALGDRGISALAESPHLAGLRALSLYSCGMTDAAARALAASVHLSRLRRLRVYE